MADIPSELLFHRRWWWDPIDMEILKGLKPDIQRQLISLSLDTQAQVLRSQAEGMEKMSQLVKSAKS